LAEAPFCPFHVVIHLPGAAEFIVTPPVFDKTPNVIQGKAQKKAYLGGTGVFFELFFKVIHKKGKRV
jgi:hypothetical protein